MGIGEKQLGVKATTEEGLGFTGRKEGVAAHASVLLKNK
jgi:2-C-methyl-D-erythritol 2,4-cyclodiphosphate synthase